MLGLLRRSPTDKQISLPAATGASVDSHAGQHLVADGAMPHCRLATRLASSCAAGLEPPAADCSTPTLALKALDSPPQAGNKAFQQQRYQQALDEYSAALAASTDDPGVNAVLHCNRAAALHALGKYVEAVADCFVAAELDPGYMRVHQRRADAYTAMGDYASAAQVGLC